MPRRSPIHRDLRSPKYRPRVVKPKTKRKKPRHKPDWRREAEERQGTAGSDKSR